MVREPEAMPFWEALSLLEGKEAVASAMTTAEWRRMPVAVRLKSQFSATLTSVKAAKAITDYLTGYVRGDKAVNDLGQEYQVYQGRAEFVAQMRDIMIEEGFGKVLHDGTLDPEIHDNDLRDLRGCRRLQLIFDTQTEQAASYAQWQEGQDPDILDIFPCQNSSASVRFTRRALTMMPLLAPSAARMTWPSGFPSIGIFKFHGGLGASTPAAVWRTWTATRQRRKASSSRQTRSSQSPKTFWKV
ncbi:hypothetical protein PVA48_12385 [Akkermansia sp. JRP_AM1]|uniref:hypothetical protein n=1 Tax=Akkermansia sp. JRP_AM1 TaxID=3414159 RepID=UPI003BFA66EF